jgi:hypothetical protein
VRLFIRAVNRQPTNVYTTLLNLALRDTEGLNTFTHVHVVSGDGDENFLHPLRGHHRVSVHVGAPATYEKIKSWMPKRRGAWSYLYFLELAAKFGEPAVVMEDDVLVTHGWVEKLAQRYAQAADMMGEAPWVLSAYYGFPHCHFKGNTSKVVPSATEPFWGNLMTLYPAHVLKPMHDAFRAVVLGATDMSTDLSVQALIRKMGGQLLYTNPSLAQHQGDTTTLRADGIRRSPVYEDE